jgi:hypothetical protein
MQSQHHQVKIQEIATGEAWLGSHRMEQEVVSPVGVVPGLDEPGARREAPAFLLNLAL